MNKEIEELLKKLKESSIWHSDSKLLLDYITNLQEDNEYLNKCNIELARRNTKAIEYNNHLIEHAKYHLNLGHLKKMKKILEGSDKE